MVVPLALGVSLWLAPAGTGSTGPRLSSRPSWLADCATGLVILLGWWAGRVIVGGIDVARRVLRRRVDVAPVVVEFRTRLPAGAIRQLAVAMYGLMPGSLVSGTDGDRLWLHSLDLEMGPQQQWRALEDRLARAVGLDLSASD